MRRAIKSTESEIFRRGLTYPNDRVEIYTLLLDELGPFCSYTEERLKTASKGEIEHYNPCIKGTPEDEYRNWLLCTPNWNKKKGGCDRWGNHQPLLDPADEDFERRIKYIDGDYVAAESDEEASNFIKYLFLNHPKLSADRKKHMENVRILRRSMPSIDLISFMKDEMEYPRMIREEFNIDII
jgi:hypothetical protein